MIKAKTLPAGRDPHLPVDPFAPKIARESEPHPMPLRIALLLDHPSPHLTALLAALAERADCRAQVLYCGVSCPHRRWGAPAGALPHRFLRPWPGPAGTRFNPGLWVALRRTRADVWVLHSIYTSPSTLLAAAWLSRRGIPWAYMNEPPQPRSGLVSRIRRPVLAWILRNARAVIGTGRRAEALYRDLAPPGTPTESVPYYEDLDPFLSIPAPRVPLPGQPIEFLAVGQMIARKGFDLLLEACSNLPADGWRLTLAGAGPLLKSLEQEFSARLPAGSVRFSGEVPFSERAALYGGAHVFVFPSRWDGWGMVLPEALAAGMPSIATDRAVSAHELLSPAENGFIVPGEQPGLLSEKMRWFMEHRERIPGMARAARESARSFRPQDGAARLVGILERISGRRMPPAGSQGAPEPPEWKSLLAGGKAGTRTYLTARTAAKRIVAGISMASGLRRRPRGSRILVYHLVLREDRARFEEHLRLLRDHYRICPLGDLLRGNGDSRSAEHRLALTFDDGFRVLMEDCLELLEKHALKATFFIPTGFVELSGLRLESDLFSLRRHCWDAPLEPMSVADLQRLVSLGHDVGSHGVSHGSLRDMALESAGLELSASRDRIAAWTGVEPAGFAYPYGETSSSLGRPADWVRAAGYRCALTLRRGVLRESTNPYLLPRDHAEGSWPVGMLRYLLFA